MATTLSLLDSILFHFTYHGSAKSKQTHQQEEQKVEIIKGDVYASERYDESKYMERINTFLNIYFNMTSTVITQQNKYSWYGLYETIMQSYPNNDINKFMNDYRQYVERMDISKEYLIHNVQTKQCCLSDCIAIKREYRDRSYYDTEYCRKMDLYDGCSENIEIFVIQMMDILHIIKHHSIETGLRQNEDINEENIKQIMKQLKQQSDKFNAIRQDRPNNTHVQNKFVTTMYEEAEEHKDEQTIINSYSFGYRYYYHEYYKNNTGKQELIPGAPHLLDETNALIDPEYRYCDWYITPKYKNLREEIIDGTDVRLTKEQFNYEFKKAKLKHAAYKRSIKGTDETWQKVYQLEKGSQITPKHIISLLLYNNFTQLSFTFSSTFRKMSPTETDESIKQRHSAYTHWGKLLRECVECWGTSLGDAPNTDVFYHGISRKLNFDGLSECFASPTSTTTSYSVAIHFACDGDDANGLVMTINNNLGNCSFFDCAAFSDFPAEQEKLFIGGLQRLNISGMTSIPDGTVYDVWISAMVVFESALINGTTMIASGPSAKDTEYVKLLVEQTISKGNNNLQKTIPSYVQKILSNILNKKTTISIDINCFEKDIVGAELSGTTYHGYPSLVGIYFNEKKQIKWNVIAKLYPSANTIYVSRVEKIKNKRGSFKHVPSIFVDEQLLDGILVNLSKSSNNWRAIFIDFPKNKKSSLSSLIAAHQPLYNKQDFELQIREMNHAQYGAYTSLIVKNVFDEW
eukprot:243134_1